VWGVVMECSRGKDGAGVLGNVVGGGWGGVREFGSWGGKKVGIGL